MLGWHKRATGQSRSLQSSCRAHQEQGLCRAMLSLEAHPSLTQNQPPILLQASAAHPLVRLPGLSTVARPHEHRDVPHPRLCILSCSCFENAFPNCCSCCGVLGHEELAVCPVGVNLKPSVKVVWKVGLHGQALCQVTGTLLVWNRSETQADCFSSCFIHFVIMEACLVRVFVKTC